MVRTHLTFLSDIPDDAEWGPQDKLIAPAGKRHMQLFAQALARYATLTGEPWNEEDFGWAFLCRVNGFTVSVLVEQAPEWLVIVSPVSLLKSLIPGRRQAALNKVCSLLHELVSTDSRFHKPRWYTFQEYDSKIRGEGSLVP